MNNIEKPIVSICAWCQKEHPSVNQAFNRDKNKFKFSHGICKRHALETMKGLPPESIENFLSKKGGGLPDLKDNPELVKAYESGIWTNNLKERFQRLANIKK